MRFVHHSHLVLLVVDPRLLVQESRPRPTVGPAQLLLGPLLPTKVRLRDRLQRPDQLLVGVVRRLVLAHLLVLPPVRRQLELRLLDELHSAIARPQAPGDAVGVSANSATTLRHSEHPP